MDGERQAGSPERDRDRTGSPPDDHDRDPAREPGGRPAGSHRQEGSDHRPAERIPRLDRSKVRLLNFGMSFVYWSAAVVCVLVAIAVLTNLGSGERDDSEYLLVAGGAVVFALLLTWTGFRTYRGSTDKD